jgi:3-methyladenine DNA glycosylase AlkD
LSGHYFFKLLILIVFYYKYGVFWLFFGCFLGFYFQQSHYLYQHQEKLPLLFNYLHSSDLWERRIAIVATWTFIKHDEFAPTLKIAKLLLGDKHDLIHKAIGWMLREVYKKDVNICKNFLRENYTQLPRTTLRYAIERMPESERLRYLKKEF